MDNSDLKNTTILDASPNTNFLNALRASGYDPCSAIADIVDNSLDTNVGSKKVKVLVKDVNGKYDYVKIVDNGCGMDIKTLKEALKLGAITGKSKTHDLGSYGTGLKSASLSIGKTFEIRTKKSNGILYVVKYDLDDLIAKNNFNIPLRIASDKECVEFEKLVESSQGTVVTISKLDRIKNKPSTFLDNLKESLGSCYKYLIEDDKVEIYVNKEKVEPIDPMQRDSNNTTCLTSNEEFSHEEHKFIFSVFHLENRKVDQNSQKGGNQRKAGLYIYRNKRLVGSGLDLGIINKTGDGYSLGIRIELFMDGDSDVLFGSTFNKIITEKNKNELDEDFKSSCKKALKGYLSTIRARERDKMKDTSVSEEEMEGITEGLEECNQNKSVVPKIGKGVNKKVGGSANKEVKNPGSKPGQRRTRRDKYVDIKLVRLGEYGDIFRTIKKNGLYNIELNKDHVFWSEFMSKTNKETKKAITKMLISLGIALEEVEYYDDDIKTNLMNEYFVNFSNIFRKYAL